MSSLVQFKVPLEDMPIEDGAELVYELSRSAGITKSEAITKIIECIEAWRCAYAEGAVEAYLERGVLPKSKQS